MAQQYRYRATEAGLLTTPYRYVEKGEEVVSDKPIKAKWLVESKKYVEKELPIMSAMSLANTQPRTAELPDISTPEYKENINRLSGVTPDDAETHDGGEQADGGTGDKDVL